MQFEEFVEEIQRSLLEYLGENHKIQIRKVYKNNGILRHGLVVIREGYNMSPTLYLEPLFEEYKNGKEFGEILLDLIQGLREKCPKFDIDMDFFRDYEKVRKGIFLKLVNREKNKELLKQIPNIPFLNLAIVFYYSIVNDYVGSGSILIYEEHFQQWKVGLESMYQDAFFNTKEQLGCHVVDMREIIRNMFREQILDNLKKKGEKDREKISLEEVDHFVLDAEEAMIPPSSSKMYVLTNGQKNMGAVGIIYEDKLKQFAEEIQRNFYILPSSIHEVILIPDTGNEDPQKLEEMVKEVNATQMEPEEILADTVYYYDRGEEKIRLV